MDENEGDIDHDAIHADFRARIEQRRRARFGPLPTVDIPQELYAKARGHRGELTGEDRALLLSRGDLIGKALAQPSSLTEAERNEVLGRQSPDQVRANIERVSNGRMSTVAELVSKTLENDIKQLAGCPGGYDAVDAS